MAHLKFPPVFLDFEFNTVRVISHTVPRLYSTFVVQNIYITSEDAQEVLCNTYSDWSNPGDLVREPNSENCLDLIFAAPPCDMYQIQTISHLQSEILVGYAKS